MASLVDFGVPRGGAGILQPKLQFKWEVVFVGIGGGGVNSQPLTLSAKTCSRPNINWEEYTIHRYNTVSYVMGKYSFDELSITFDDDVKNLATNVIQQQITRQQQLIGAGAPWLAHSASGSDYKFGVVCRQLDGNEQSVEEWHYEGCWIKNSNYNDLDYSSSDAATITTSIRFDIVRQVLMNANTSGLALGGTS